MVRLTQCIRVNAPVHVIDDIVRDPQQWPTFRCGIGPPEILVGDGSPGTSLRYDVFIAGVRLSETAHVRGERHGKDGSTHWRWIFEGPTRGWLACHHEPIEGGTLLRTQLEYEVPGSVLGKAADRLFLEKRQRRDLYLMVDRLKSVAEARAGSQAA